LNLVSNRDDTGNEVITDNENNTDEMITEPIDKVRNPLFLLCM
jgi:hypothetical protein